MTILSPRHNRGRNNTKYDDENIGKCAILNQNVETDTELKKLIVEYVGNSLFIEF